MMKYLSIVFFLVLTIWTWSIVHQELPISFETHAGIQSSLTQLLTDAVKNKKPGATDIFVEKIWTEPISDMQVKAHFRYRFRLPTEDGSMTQSEITGEGILEHQAADESGFDRWKLYDIKATSDAIQFEDALIITTGEKTEPTQ